MKKEIYSKWLDGSRLVEHKGISFMRKDEIARMTLADHTSIRE